MCVWIVVDRCDADYFVDIFMFSASLCIGHAVMVSFVSTAAAMYPWLKVITWTGTGM